MICLAFLGTAACKGAEQSPLHSISAAWSAAPTDSSTIDVPLGAPVTDAEVLVTLQLDSILGFRLPGAAYKLRIVEDGFVVVERADSGRLLRFDSLGNQLADIAMAGMSDPGSAAVCARGDLALVVDGAGNLNQPRRLFWFTLRSDAVGAVPDSVTVSLPVGTLDVGCMSVGDRWVLLATIPEEPGNLSSRLTYSLLEVAPEFGVRESPLITLTDRSEQMRDSSGLAMTQASPWASPPLIAASGNGRLYVADGPTGVVRILDTTAAGAKLRGITPRPQILTRAVIDSVASARREQDAAAAARRGPLTPNDVAMLDRAMRAIRGISPGVPVPEIERLLVGADGSFALVATEWLVPDADRWDLFDQNGGYLGAVRIPAASRGVGVQNETLWYVRTVGDSANGAPELIRVRPVLNQ